MQLGTGQGSHACAVGLGNQVVCWGDNSSGACEAPPGQFFHVSVGGGYTCALRLDGAVICWGRNDKGQSTPPGGPHLMVSAGLKHSCAIRHDGSVACWGQTTTGRQVHRRGSSHLLAPVTGTPAA